MSLQDRIDTWLEASSDRHDPHAGVPKHSRGGTLQASTPAIRIVELTQHLNLLRGYLYEAVIELKREAVDAGRFHTFHGTSFAGVTMAQHWNDLVVWEAMLNEIPVLGGIVEIGTWQGGFSRWLCAQADNRGGSFITYDAVKPDSPPPNFQRLDVFLHSDSVIEKIRQFEELFPVVVFCDGGNKPRELATFAPAITHPDSIIAVHDWGTETMEKDVPDSLVMLNGDWCAATGSITRFFKRRSDAA